MRVEIVRTGTKAQRQKCGRRILLGDDTHQDQTYCILDCHQTYSPVYARTVQHVLPPDILPCACTYSSARIATRHTPLCMHVHFSAYHWSSLGENFDVRPTSRKLLLNESGSVWSYLVSDVYEIISYDVRRSRKASDVRHGIVFNVSVQKWCSVVQYNKKDGSCMNNDRLLSRQTVPGTSRLNTPPPLLKLSTCKWIVKSNAEIREGKLHVHSQMQESLTRNLISEKWFWFTERLKTNTKLVIWRNEAAEIESVPVIWGEEIHGIVLFDKKWTGYKELRLNTH